MALPVAGATPRRYPEMKPISKSAWNRVHEKACDVANGARSDNDPMYEFYREQMLEILDELETEFGAQSQILDTRADYIDDPHERRRLYTSALELARAQNDEDEIKVVLQSIRNLQEEPLPHVERDQK